MTATKLKKQNMKRWGVIHFLSMQVLGYKKDDLERFCQVAYFICEWVDLSGTLPKSRDLIACKAVIETLPHA